MTVTNKPTLTCLTIIFAVICLAFSTTGCSTIPPNDQNLVESRLIIHLTDSPLDWNQVARLLITFDKIELYKYNHQTGSIDLTDLITVPAVFNLLDFTGGKTALVADINLPADYYSGLILHFGPVVIIQTDGLSQSAALPVSIANGLNIQHPIDLSQEERVELIIDIDAHYSLKVDNSSLIFDPLLRAGLANEVSGIKGKISNFDLLPSEIDLEGQLTRIDTVRNYTFNISADGEFSQNVLPPGNYLLEINSDQGYYLQQEVTLIPGNTLETSNLELLYSPI